MTDEFREHEWTDEEEAEVQDNLRRCNPFVAVALLLLGVAALCSVEGCDSPIIAEKSVIISGEVVDADTQEPLDSVWAALGDTLLPEARWYSEVEGRFSVTSTPFLRPLSLSIGREGYLTTVDTLEDVQSNLSGLHYELEPAP